MNAIELKDLKKTYAGGTHALKGVTLDVKEGDFFALLGPNGAGKTSIISIISNLATKTSGSVRVFGTEVSEDPALAKTYIGLVPQEFNFNIFEKVIDIVTTQAGYYGIPLKEARERADVILKELGLFEKRNEPSQRLSGGMKRRLMIARALIHKPRLLILDEPTAGVDIEMRLGMWEFLKRMNKEEGTTIILTTHYLEEAEELCNTVAIINKGEVRLHEPMQKVLEAGKESLEKVYLDIIQEAKQQNS